MNMTIEKANQQKVFEELKVKGDCWHDNKDVYGPSTCGKCGIMTVWRWEAPLPDLTTEAGAFWLLKRLTKWKRRSELDRWLDKMSRKDNTEKTTVSVINCCVDVFTWLVSDAKDGKAPALYNALCEFMGLEVKG